MNEQTTRVTIEPAQNGYMVYINDAFMPGTIKTIPYVFETMESLLQFIKTRLV